MPDDSQTLRLDEDIAVHIFSVSAAMVCSFIAYELI